MNVIWICPGEWDGCKVEVKNHMNVIRICPGVLDGNVMVLLNMDP
jgi:hypothetical protein